MLHTSRTIPSTIVASFPYGSLTVVRDLVYVAFARTDRAFDPVYATQWYRHKCSAPVLSRSLDLWISLQVSGKNANDSSHNIELIYMDIKFLLW